jgi:CheY-like chemotaxis protein
MAYTLLVIDDDKGVQHLLREVLEEEGYHVLLAADGFAALEVLQTTTPDLIVLDYMMPRMDGTTFAQELERRGQRQSIPIVFFSANNRAQEQADAIHPEGYISKPFEIQDLLDTLDRLLG